MKLQITFVAAVLAAIVATCASASWAEDVSSLSPAKLRCEYLTNPAGLDTRAPRFSWILETADKEAIGQSQQSYRIRVDATEAAAKELQGKLWDTGWVESDATAQIAYAGEALKSDAS